MKIAVCYPGTEPLVEEDLNGKKLIEGRVSFEKGDKFGAVRTVYSLIEHFEFKDYEDLLAKVSKLKFEFEGTFRVNCSREGEHEFDSQTAAVEIGEIIYKRGFKVDLKNPDKIVYVDILDKHCLIGFLEKDDLCKRDYRVRLVSQSINACVVYCMLKMLGKGDLIDPFCKDGIILIEASRMGLGKVYGDDTNKNNLGHTKTNSELAGVEVKFVDFKDFKDKINIATFLPAVFERTKANEFRIEEFFEVANKVAKKLVVCTFNPDIAKKYCKLKLEKEITVNVGENNYSLITWASL